MFALSLLRGKSGASPISSQAAELDVVRTNTIWLRPTRKLTSGPPIRLRGHPELSSASLYSACRFGASSLKPYIPSTKKTRDCLVDDVCRRSIGLKAQSAKARIHSVQGLHGEDYVTLQHVERSTCLVRAIHTPPIRVDSDLSQELFSVIIASILLAVTEITSSDERIYQAQFFSVVHLW